MTRSEDTLELLTSSFDLIRGKIDDEVWLQKLASAMHAQSAICIRWTCGIPDKTNISTYGNSDFLPAGWTNWADHIFNLAKSSACSHVDDIAASLKQPTLADASPINSPQLMVCLADWSPAYICMIVHRDPALGPWSDENRAYFLELCALIRKSIEVHKDFSRQQNLASATVDILNASPRGVIAISTDGTIQFSNTLSMETLSLSDGLSSNQGELEFSDKSAQEKLTEFVGTIKQMPLEKLTMINPEAIKSFKATRPSKHAPYQIMLSATPLSNWTLETSPSDRMVVIYVHDPHKPMQATARQFMDYYELTKAQSKFAHTLCASGNIIGASETLNISINTARSHLREIYRKTGTNSQPELIRLLTSSLMTYTQSS